MTKILISLIALSVFPLVAVADDSSDGCGLGWKIVKGTTLSATTTRATTNAYFPPTFSMTSGTSGCAKHPLVKKDEPAAIYAFNNLDTLRIEMAEGRGEFLQGFARILGCEDAALPAFGRMTQKHYQSIVPAETTSAFELLENIQQKIKQDTALASGCSGEV